MSRILRLLIAQLVAQQRHRVWREAKRRASTYDSGYESAQDTQDGADDRSGAYGSNGYRTASGATRDPEIARCYAALELSYGADFVAVRQSYKRLVKLYHPDRFATDPEKMQTATQLVRELNDAYERLRRHLDVTGR